MTGSPSIETQHSHPEIVLATLSLANVMALLDLFVVNVALHDIGVGLHYQSSLSDVAWVLNAYALFFGALLIPAVRFADKYGRKATFILGLAVFTVASLACAVSPDLLGLVTASRAGAVRAGRRSPARGSYGRVATPRAAAWPRQRRRTSGRGYPSHRRGRQHRSAPRGTTATGPRDARSQPRQPGTVALPRAAAPQSGARPGSGRSPRQHGHVRRPMTTAVARPSSTGM